MLNKLLKRFVNSDVTKMLVLDTRSFVADASLPDLTCSMLDSEQLCTLASDQAFGLSEAFVRDFEAFGFSGIAARLGNEVVGVSFLAKNRVPTRHNRGGDAFRGIGLRLPADVQFLFKVEVRPEWRGRRIHSAMILHVIEHLGTQKLRAIVTTTDWRNRAFLASAYRQGFKPSGYASEFVVAGAHLYQLPKPLDALPSGDLSDGNVLRKRVVTCYREETADEPS